MNYDTLGRRTQLTRPSGISTSYAYDPIPHLQSVMHKLGVNTLDGAMNAIGAGLQDTSVWLVDRRVPHRADRVDEGCAREHNSGLNRHSQS